MRIIGLNRTRSIRESIFSYSLILVCFYSLIFSGCRNSKTTNLYYSNFSDNKVIFRVMGVTPDVSPSSLQPGDGVDLLTEVSTHIYDPVHFNDIVKIEWTIGDDATKHEQEFRRDDLGIPSVINGGKVTFIYTQTGNWEIKYSK